MLDNWGLSPNGHFAGAKLERNDYNEKSIESDPIDFLDFFLLGD